MTHRRSISRPNPSRKKSAPGATRTAASVSIRPITRRDGKAFLALIDALADYEKLPRPRAAAKRRLVRDCTGAGKRFEALIARSGPVAVGYAVFFETYSTFLARPTLYLEDLFVLPAHRGFGTGLRLFRAVLSEAKRRGCGRMDWTVLDWNTGAASFYKRLGAMKMKEWELFRLERKQFDRALRPGL
jgi:GNAT superfamily N-acetyltransferase